MLPSRSIAAPKTRQLVIKAPPGKPARILSASVNCVTATAVDCFAVETITGYEVMNCSNPSGQSDANGGTTLLRADMVSCKASASAGVLTVTDWNFAASDGSFLLNRRDHDPGFSPDPTSWAGVVVESGTVTIKASIGTVAQPPKSVLIAVVKRPGELNDYVRTMRPVADGPGRTSRFPALLRKWNLGTFMGSHVISVTGSPAQIRQQMAFDATDNPSTLASLGCSIYLES